MHVAPKRVAVPRRIAAAGVAVVAGASLVVAGCGGGAAAGAGGASAVAGFIPAGSPMYLEVSTDVDGAQWAQALAVAKRFPGYASAVESLTRDLTSNGVDFETELKPLLGSTAGIGLTDVTGLGAAKDADPKAVAAIDLADGKDAEFVALIRSGKDPATPLGDHQGVALYGVGDAVLAVVDGTVVVAETKAELVRALDAHRAGGDRTMAASSKLDEAFAELPDEVLAQGFVDVAAMITAAERGGAGTAAKQLSDAGVGADAAFGVSVQAEADGFRVKAVGIDLGAASAKLEPFTPKLVEHVPADALAYVGVRNVYPAAAAALAQGGARSADAKKQVDAARLALPLLGVSEDDIKELTSREHAVVVTKGSPTPGVVAALEVADAQRATATLDTLRTKVPALLSSSGTTIPPFTPVTLANGVRGWRSAISPKAGVVYGVEGDIAYVGTTAEAVKQVQAPGSTLAENPAYRAATRQMPPKVDSVVWLNGEGIVTALDTLGALKNAPKELIANLRPLKNVAAWSTGGDTPTFEAFLTVR